MRPRLSITEGAGTLAQSFSHWESGRPWREGWGCCSEGYWPGKARASSRRNQSTLWACDGSHHHFAGDSHRENRQCAHFLNSLQEKLFKKLSNFFDKGREVLLYWSEWSLEHETISTRSSEELLSPDVQMGPILPKCNTHSSRRCGGCQEQNHTTAPPWKARAWE